MRDPSKPRVPATGETVRTDEEEARVARVFEVEETIGRPAEEVWAALTDWEHAGRWMPGIDSMRADGPTAAGTELTFRTRGRERPAELTQVHPGRAVAIRSVQGGVTADYSYELHPDDDGTRVTLVAECHTRGLPWSALGPVLRAAMRRADSHQLAALKQVVEQG